MKLQTATYVTVQYMDLGHMREKLQAPTAGTAGRQVDLCHDQQVWPAEFRNRVKVEVAVLGFPS